jgi:hypothetical protein
MKSNVDVAFLLRTARNWIERHQLVIEELIETTNVPTILYHTIQIKVYILKQRFIANNEIIMIGGEREVLVLLLVL